MKKAQIAGVIADGRTDSETQFFALDFDRVIDMEDPRYILVEADPLEHGGVDMRNGGKLYYRYSKSWDDLVVIKEER